MCRHSNYKCIEFCNLPGQPGIINCLTQFGFVVFVILMQEVVGGDTNQGSLTNTNVSTTIATAESVNFWNGYGYQAAGKSTKWTKV